MKAPAKLAAFGLTMGAVFVAALGVGAAVGSAPSIDRPSGSGDGHDAMAMAGMGAGDLPRGLAASSDGYTLAPTTTVVPAGETTPFAFRVLGPDGSPLTRYRLEHERELHFIVVRRDMTGYQHLHPTRAADGTWSVPLSLTEAGTYKVFADFQPAGAAMPTTLGIDLSVPGDFRPVPPAAPSSTAAVDGFTVTMGGTLAGGRSSDVTLRVTKDGAPVTDLQPYLGAFGHLVALRSSDLAYLHVHPDGEPGDGRTPPGPDVAFHAEVPTAGAYGLFFGFQVDGVVHTAQFTANAEEAP